MYAVCGVMLTVIHQSCLKMSNGRAVIGFLGIKIIPRPSRYNTTRFLSERDAFPSESACNEMVVVTEPSRVCTRFALARRDKGEPLVGQAG